MTELIPENLEANIEAAHQKIEASFEEFTQRGSGWVLEKINYLQLCCATYEPLAASSYIPLPPKLVAKKAILNIKNEDQKCFVWCLLAHMMNIHWKDYPECLYHYSAFESEIKMGNVECPVPISKIPIIEKLNNLRINVYGYEKAVFPLYISNQTHTECINLLLISDEDKQHYCLIRNMSRLLADLTRHEHARYYCERCLHRFSEERLLKEHSKYCADHDAQHIKMPEVGEDLLTFTNINYQHPVPYIIYADFEAIIAPISTAQPNPSKSYVTKKSLHVPCGYAYVIVGPDGKTYKPIKCYRGLDTVDHFLQNLLEDREELADKLKAVQPIQMSPTDQENFRSAQNCYLCKKPLGRDRVRDHDHLTGQYRGALHNLCNLKYRLKKVIPVVFHNLKNYDAHHIMQGLGKIKDYEFQVIATNMEKYITFSMSKKEDTKGVRVHLQFIDSLQFLNTSLEKLVNNMNHSQFNILKENISGCTDLLLRKGIYPYEYISTFNKFQETCLPPQSAFYSSLSEEHITDEDYQHAQNVWRTFNICDLGEYHDLYVKSDVLLLADVFENFRKICKQHYDLDCAHVFTAPGLSWQACLKRCNQPLELFTDINMHLLIERGIRGGISTITHRWAEANNKYLENYDPTKPSSYIMYLDANNLYGWAMSQALPYGEFEWVSSEGITHDFIMSLSDDATEGYIFEVDLEYPTTLHEIHNDYPLAPEKLQITEEMWSPYNKQLMQNSKLKKCTKLTPNLMNKKNYVVHYRNLKLYLSLGLKLQTVHKVLRFQQRAWLKEYILFNTEQRKKAQSNFEKDFFKLMNNAVYGKTMENVRNHTDIQLVNNTKRAKKLVAAPTYKSFSSFTEELVGVERIRKTVTLNKPIYVGFSILELSKLHMYNFHYNHIKHHYNDKAQLLFTDTDSLTYHIFTDDIYQDMANHLTIYDTSDYPQDHPLYNIDNKKKIGCFKDELNGRAIKEFVGLRAKMYSILAKNIEKKTAKGVSKSVIKNKIKHQHYRECLLNSSIRRDIQARIQSYKHELFTTEVNKISLSSFDDKRYILSDGVQSLAYGHYSI